MLVDGADDGAGDAVGDVVDGGEVGGGAGDVVGGDATDLFGNPTAESLGLDLSDKGIESRIVDAGPDNPDAPMVEEAAEKHAESLREGEGGAGSDDGSDAGEGDTDAQGDDGGAGDGDAPTIPSKLAGKTPEELAAMYEQMESHFSQQVTELSRSLQEQRAEMAALQAIQTPQYDVNEMLEGLDPVSAYRTALGLMDAGQVDADRVNMVIHETRALDPDLAFEMARDFDQRTLRSEFEKRQAEIVQPIQTQIAEQNLAIATHEFYTSNPDAEVYKDDIVKIVQSQPGVFGTGTRQEIAGALQSALVYARGQDPTRSVAYKKAINDMKANSVVESGSAAPPPPPSEEELIRQQLFNRKDPAADLFS